MLNATPPGFWARVAVLCFAILVLLPQPAIAQITNGNFSSGSSGWTLINPGDGSISFSGNRANVTGINNSSASNLVVMVRQTATTGNVLEFDLRRYTTNDIGTYDYPVFYLDGTVYGLNSNGTLAGASSPGTINNGNPTNSTVHFTVALTPGSHTIGFGVLSTDTCCGAGTAEFDNVTTNSTDTVPPTIVSQPSNLTVPTDPGVSTRIVNYSTPTFNDNVGVTSVVRTAGPASGSAFPLGPTTVTYRASDAAGNTTDATFIVTVVDQESPQISGTPANVSHATDPGSATYTYSWTPPTATDNVAVTSFTVALSGAATLGPQSAASLSSFNFPIGVTTVTYSANDAANNGPTTTSFTVTVTDTEVPVISACPAGQTIEATGPSGAVASWTGPTASDNSGSVTLTRTTGLASGSTFPLGTTTVTYTAVDPSTNAAVPCTFNILVQDTTPPTINAISNIVVTAPDLTGANVTFPLPTATDLVDTSVTVTTNPVSGSFFSIGVHTVQVTATDDAGNQATSSFTVTVRKPAALDVTPGTDFVAVGPQGQQGGSFSPTSAVYTVTNNGDVSMDFTVTGAPSWVTLSSTGGTLGPGASATVTISLNSGADALAVGNHVVPVAFNNTTSSIGNTTRNVNLTVLAPAALSVTPATAFSSSGPQGQQGAAFTPSSASYTLQNTGALPMPYTVTGAPGWVNVAPASGTIAAGDSVVVTVSFTAAADALPVGVHNATLAFNNDANGIGNTSRNVSLTINEPARLGVSPANGLVASGYQGGPFSPSSQTFQLSNTGAYPLDFSLAEDQSWTEVSPSGGTIPPGGNVTVTLSINGTADTLPSGTHNATLTLSNTTNGLGSTSRPVVLTVIPNGTVILRVVTSEGDGDFTFSSSTSALNLALSTSGGSAQSTPIVLNPGSYDVTVATPAGFGLTGVTCSDGDSTGNVGAKSANIVLASAETVTCTFSTVNSRKKTVEVISRFMSRRNDLLLTNGPDPNRQIERLQAADGRGGGEASSFAQNGKFGSSSKSALGGPSRLSDNDPTASFGSSALHGSRGVSRSFDQRLADLHGDETTGSDEARPAGSPFMVRGSTEGADRFQFSTSLSQMLRHGAESENARVKSLLGDSAMGLGAMTVPTARTAFTPFDIWVEGQYFRFSDDRDATDTDGHFGIFYLGADYVFSRYFLLGALVQFDSMHERSSREDFDIEGKGWMAGPYATIRLSENVFLQSRAAFGRSTNEVSPFLTYTDKFSSRRWLASTSLVGNWVFDNLQFRPRASIAYIEDVSDSYVDSLGVTIPGIRTSLGQAKAGPEFSYRFEHPDGSVIEPRVAIEAIWNFDAGNQIVDFGDTLSGPEEVRGRVELGFRATSAAGIAVDVSGSYDGIGSDDFRSVGGKATIRVPLN